ncbi:MAG TPA: hypothetical protein VNI57_00815 [Candidatus Saccharimonadales bacterium]|nr:hypothetical protein [Candidatus Saccharimonadales bacterium]
MRSSLLAFSLLALAVPAAASAPGPLGLDQVVSLVKAGVGEPLILRQASDRGLAFDVGVDEVLALKHAGAGDSLINSLMDLAGATGASQAGAEVAPSTSDPGEQLPFRIYTDTDENGQPVLHITNLDASGKRMGGPVQDEQPAPENAYRSRGEPAAETADEEPASGAAAPPPQVVVNVFNPASEPVASTGEVPVVYPGGYLPGYAYYGRGLLGYAGVPSPPGSWSHYKRYHAPESAGYPGLYNGTLWYRESHPAGGFRGVRHLSGGALPVPFNTAGAATLDRMRSRVRLGH